MLQVFFYGKGEILYSYSFLNIYIEGLESGTIYMTKILTVLLLATFITNCTKPTDLTEGLKFFLYPLKYVGLPVKDIATSISITITFIPVIYDEAIKIWNAQLIRGGKISIKKFPIIVYSIILPIILNTIERSEKLALTMDLRGYNLNPKEIQFNNLKWTFKDTFLIFTSLLLLLPKFL
ncbi:energy-coupling factor transporter transmembrane component T family protein [Heyndrickxia shackletonii]|uniref:energy-coupling factor transporter transmembrane component T family protein n=1 Tax=Heyndrickxia shackletonii TaxID=157838 RepID=UPI0034633565